MKISRLRCWGDYREVSGHTGPKVPSRISEPKEQGVVRTHRWRKREATVDEQRTPEFVTTKLVNASFFFFFFRIC